MKFVIAAIIIFLFSSLIVAGPIYVEVTPENPQDHIEVRTSKLDEDFWAFSVRVGSKGFKFSKDWSAYLILRNDKNINLLSTPIKPAELENGIKQFYAAVHSNLLKWAGIHLRDSMTIYVIELESFKEDFERK